MVTLGVLIGNRGFFPAHLCTEGRRQILRVLETEGIRPLLLPEEATRNGAVESLSEARQYADFFKAHREELDGILVSLPNFGDERALSLIHI
jgi:L-fucose isomerase-like protein